MGRVRELQDEVKRLEGEIQDLKIAVESLYEITSNLHRNLDDRIDARIEGKVRVRTVENLTAYQKGKKIKPYLDEIF